MIPAFFLEVTVGGTQWTGYEERILLDNKELSTKELMGLLPGRSRSSVTSRLKYLGIAKPVGHRKYNINMSFFSEPDPINSYFAGFIAADGCISPKKHLVSFGIKAGDGYILEELVKHSKFEGQVSYTKQGYPRADLFIWGVKKWHEDLKRHFNITPQKSLTLQPPSVKDDSCIRAFIRGYIDGDGGVYPLRGSNEWVIKVVGTHSVIEWIYNYFGNLVPPTSNKFAKPWPYGNVWGYSPSGKRSVKILKKLLEVDTPYLKRKWNPIIEYLGL